MIPAETLAVLTKAETDYNALKTSADEAAANQAAADAVIAKINAIGTVAYTSDSKTKIDAAREAYNALTSDQKALVTNYSTLTTAESSYESLAPVRVTAITLNKTATEIKVGSTETLSVTAVAPDNATDKTYTWKTSDASKATVTAEGVVTAVAEGTVTIYAEANDGSGVKGNCTVTVAPATITVTAITLNKTATTINKLNGTATETLSVTAVTPDEATDKTYTWSSDATGIATVDENGVVTAVAAGTAHIRATANDGSGVYGECTVTVSDLSAYYSKMVECGCDNLDGKCYNGRKPENGFTGQVLSAAQAIALAQAKAAETSSNCAVFYDKGSCGFADIAFAKNDGTTGSAQFIYTAGDKGLTGYRGFYVSK